jgi:hypothetical protein
MNVKFAYLGRSALRGEGKVISLSPNLARDPVAFDAPLLHPLRFREAVSTLHDVVISDLRFKKRDKAAYEEWKKSEQLRLAEIKRAEYARAKKEVLERQPVEVPADFEKQFEKSRRKYWHARQNYANYLYKQDVELWRLLMPCDPVITVSPDVVFFECFSADESSYGCLTVNRDGFGKSDNVKLGTTNVDYSWELYNHFQSLRSYRETRFRIDPAGFEVATAGNPDYREEKIDLPPSWLRGFMQIQSAMGLPMRKVSLSREALYSVCAWLKRHRARSSPRALRFELLPDKPPKLILEPWEQPIVSHGTKYSGPGGEPIRVWGTRRLLVLARLLPLIESLDVYLLGTGLPHFWVAKMGEMRLTLGLSGWTTNDWTGSSALDLLAPTAEVPREMIYDVSRFVRESKSPSFAEINAGVPAKPGVTAAALNHLAHAGQLIYDLHEARYRWRQIMPMALGEDQMGPENPELVASRQILLRGRVKLESSQSAPNGGMLHTGKADGTPVELLLDSDGRIKRAKCTCSHHFRAGIRKGPCRHLLSLRALIWRGTAGAVAEKSERWYDFGYLFKGG